MPFSIPAPDVVLTDANFTTPLKSFVDGLETSTAAAQSTATAANTLAGQKYTKPSGGIPASDLDAASQALIGNVQVRRYVSGAWQVRGTTSTAVTVLWVKPVSANPDPPIDATYFLQGVDLLLKAA